MDLIDPMLTGHRRDGEYVVRGLPTSGRSGWMTRSDSEGDREREAPRIDVALSSQSLVQRGERDAPKSAVVLSIQSSIQGSMREATSSSVGKRVSWYDLSASFRVVSP